MECELDFLGMIHQCIFQSIAEKNRHYLQGNAEILIKKVFQQALYGMHCLH